VTAGIVARVWRCLITGMVRGPGHDPPGPVHTALMTGIAAPWRHHPAMDHLRPAEGRRGLVTGLARRGGREVVRRLAHHPDVGTAMTGHAARHYSRMVILGPRKRRRRLVTGFARGGGWEVGRRLAHHPGISSAMAGRTTGHDPGVIHRCPRPKGSRRAVTRLAPQRRWYMSRRLAQRRGSVMTSRAAGRDPRVIKRGPRECGRGLVTVLAREARRDVIRRFRHDAPDPAHARRMAARAARRDPRVIHHRPRKRGRGLVARLAGRSGREVVRRLAQRRGTVMTARAAGRDPRVIVRAGCENPVAPHLVATITRCGSHHVGRRLSTGLDPVMTGCAGAWRNSKMPERQAGPGNSPMAIVARHSRRNVRDGLSLRGTIVMAL